MGNTMPPPTTRTYWQILRENVFTFINNCLFLLGLTLIVLGRPTDAMISVGVISMNVLVSVVQEIRAKRTLDRIALLTRPTATVIRDGQEQSLQPEALVVGDLLKIEPGDQVVVDGEVISGRMALDESQLTGESDHIPKGRGDSVYSGSFCVTGTGYYVARKVGTQSLANEITAGARAFRRILTPLQRDIYLVIRIMLLLVLYFEFLLVLNSLFQHIDVVQTVQNSVIVAGLIPNGLFLSISVAYALAAVRIIRFGALVQQANAIESLSNVDVLCLDKTGTLTTNTLRLHDIFPVGTTREDLERTLGDMMASTASHNKTSEAIAAAYVGHGEPVVSEIPFSSARKWSAVVFGGGAADSGRRGVYALGAPEMLRPYLVESDEDSEQWRIIATQAQELAERGLRVLLVAHLPAAVTLVDEGDQTRLPEGMAALGLVSLRDELRPEAHETLAEFSRAGVRVKIISGDNQETVATLGRQAGLAADIEVVSGLDLREMDATEVGERAESATVFGRIAPNQKQQLVEALRQRGHYVAMIGDGVNDVLSLKQANLAIAMQSGSQATRAVADLILMGDSFAALAPAVTEGQRIVNGMFDILKLFLTRVTTIAAIIVSSLVIGVFPLSLRHGSLLTLLSVGIPTIFLAYWSRSGPTPRGGVFRRLLHFVLAPALVSSVVGLLLFYGEIVLLYWRDSGSGGGPIHEPVAAHVLLAQTTLASFLVICGLLLVIFVEPPTAWWAGGNALGGDWRPTILATGLLVAFIFISIVPGLRNFFALASLGPWEFLLLLIAVPAWLFLVRWLWRARLMSRFLSIELE